MRSTSFSTHRDASPAVATSRARGHKEPGGAPHLRCCRACGWRAGLPCPAAADATLRRSVSRGLRLQHELEAVVNARPVAFPLGPMIP